MALWAGFFRSGRSPEPVIASGKSKYDLVQGADVERVPAPAGTRSDIKTSAARRRRANAIMIIACDVAQTSFQTGHSTNPIKSEFENWRKTVFQNGRACWFWKPFINELIPVRGELVGGLISSPDQNP
ncbi:MAG: hypothetical protein CMF17_00860 [Idiomarinaceae bacterium]|nr:hypothetical protein [Idiomarinaceae bacterium]